MRTWDVGLWSPFQPFIIAASRPSGARVRLRLQAGWGVSLGLLVGLAGCSYGQNGVDPKAIGLNRHPSEVIDVSGVVAQPLRVDRLRVVFRTRSSLPFCNGITLPDGGPFPLRATVSAPTIQVGDRVSARVYADRFAAGLCGWRFAEAYAVVRDEDRDETQALIAANSSEVSSDRDFSRLTTTHYCGYRGEFGCSQGPIGDPSYLPITIDPNHRRVQFVIRISAYPPTNDYRAPCRDPVTDVVTYPCRSKGAQPPIPVVQNIWSRTRRGGRRHAAAVGGM